MASTTVGSGWTTFRTVTGTLDVSRVENTFILANSIWVHVRDGVRCACSEYTTTYEVPVPYYRAQDRKSHPGRGTSIWEQKIRPLCGSAWQLLNP
jgi:hypothetical protein